MAVNRCPRCRLVNPPSARKCDCGYSFADGTVGAPLRVRSTPPSGGGVNGPLIAGGLIAIVIGAVITIVTYQSAAKMGGGRYLVAYGPILFGVSLVIRGLVSRRGA